jgi:hypothetical protein
MVVIRFLGQSHQLVAVVAGIVAMVQLVALAVAVVH